VGFVLHSCLKAAGGNLAPGAALWAGNSTGCPEVPCFDGSLTTETLQRLLLKSSYAFFFTQLHAVLILIGFKY